MRSYVFRLSILFSFFVFLFSTTIAYAHFPATDGNMTVTLHVDPNDDPIPGKQAHLYFLFDDATNRFKLANCTCTVSITELGKQTYIQQLSVLKSSKPSIWGASLPYIFPERNVYHIVLTGNPKKANEFQSFTLSWYFRVDTINPGLVQTQQGPPDIVVLLGALGVVILGLIVFGFFIKKEFGH
jgi:hypothetical protein